MSSAAQQRKIQRERKFKKVMDEWKAGRLRSGSGAPVTSQDQAIAIAMHATGQSNRKDMGAAAPAMSSVNATMGGAFVPPPSFAGSSEKPYHWTPRPFRQRKLKRIVAKKSLLAQVRADHAGKSWRAWNKSFEDQPRVPAGEPGGGQWARVGATVSSKRRPGRKGTIVSLFNPEHQKWSATRRRQQASGVIALMRQHGALETPEPSRTATHARVKWNAGTTLRGNRLTHSSTVSLSELVPHEEPGKKSLWQGVRQEKSLWEQLCQRRPGRFYVCETKDFGGPRFALDLPFTGQPQFNDEELSITFPFAASHGRDRVGDFLDVAGIDTTNHRRNPVAFIDHGKWHALPIGKCEDPQGNYTVKIYPDQGLAIATVFLDKNPESKVVQQVYGLFKQGILRAGSIGYRPQNKPKRLPADPDTGTPEGNFLDRTELLEVTLTGLPANGDAVRRTLEQGWQGKAWEPEVKSMLEAILTTAA